MGMHPLCENYLKRDQLSQMEPFYPLIVYVCDKCFLVQLEEQVSCKEIFSEYAYFSSYSEAWLKHAKKYVEKITERLKLNKKSQVIEVASNDGYLLQYFLEKGIPVLGIDPAANIAEVARKKGVPTLVEFLDSKIAKKLAYEGIKADLIIGNNVLAQVPNLDDFVESLKIILKSTGTITMEFPHLMRLIEHNQFDTIYHEHFSYFLFTTVEKIFAAHKLMVFDVEELLSHGGSLRIYACHSENTARPVISSVDELRTREQTEKYLDLQRYFTFASRVRQTKRRLLSFLIRLKEENKSIVGYGAPGKGNTLLNYCGIGLDFLDYTVDINPYKQGKFLSGTHIPIYHPDKIKETKPDYILILPWNIKEEIMEKLSYIGKWDGRLIVPIPRVSLYKPVESDFIEYTY